MAEKKMTAVAVVPSAGLGRRMGGIKKNYLELASLPLLVHSLRALEKCGSIDSIIVVTAAGDEAFCKEEIVKKYAIEKVAAIVPGGETRQDSVAKGIKAAGPGYSVVVVHDGARPLVTPAIIERCVKKAAATGAAITAVRVKDTIKTVSSGLVASTLKRDTLYSVQTPQAFGYALLSKAHEKAQQEGFIGTDEASLVERLGVDVTVVEGSYENIKITTPEDLPVAEAMLSGRAAPAELTGEIKQ